MGDKEVIAEFKGSYSTTYDFVDHFRGGTAKYDRQWEDRWIRDLGFAQLIPEVVKGLFDKYKLKMSDFAKVIYPCHYPAARKGLNKKLGIAPEMEQSNLQIEIGETGTPQALAMFVRALEEASPGDKILLISFGSGCDALAYCSEVYRNATTSAIQVLGGTGFSWEHDIHLYLKRAKANEAILGDPAYHREQVARLITAVKGSGLREPGFSLTPEGVEEGERTP